jgi:hypothetical protein
VLPDIVDKDFTLVGAKRGEEYEKVLGQVAKECTVRERMRSATLLYTLETLRSFLLHFDYSLLHIDRNLQPVLRPEVRLVQQIKSKGGCGDAESTPRLY